MPRLFSIPRIPNRVPRRSASVSTASHPHAPKPPAAPAKPIQVSNEYKVVVLEENEEVVMFTQGLGKALGVAATNGMVNASQTFGLAHLEETLTPRDFPYIPKHEAAPLIRLSQKSSLLNEQDLTKILDAFQPYRLMQLLDEIKKRSQSQVPIEVFLGNNDKPNALSQIYEAYVKTRYDLRLHNMPLKPYQLTPMLKVSPLGEAAKTLATSFSISTSGEVVLAKRAIEPNQVKDQVKQGSFFDKASEGVKQDKAQPNSMAVIERTAKI